MDSKQANILAQLNQARDQLLSAIDGLDAKALSAEIVVGEQFHYRHMFDHARMLERWRTTRSRKRT